MLPDCYACYYKQYPSLGGKRAAATDKQGASPSARSKEVLSVLSPVLYLAVMYVGSLPQTFVLPSVARNIYM